MRQDFSLRSCGRLLILLLWAGLSLSCHDTAKDSQRSLSFAVASDPHLYATELGTQGEAFAAIVQDEQKLLALSADLFAQFVSEVIAEDPPLDFVLIPGDLTKDGELRSHQQMAAQLARLEAAGIEAYVVPGNHDIANPQARGYSATGEFAVPSISAREFSNLYADFGYRQAIARDPASLSYISELAPDLWLVAIDSCRYQENTKDLHQIGGRIHPETLRWLVTRLRQAAEANIQIIGMLHHGMTEHYLGQGQQFPDFLVEDWPDVSHQLAMEGLNLVFTGHFHSQDITRVDWRDGAFLLDVETASTAGYPNSYRLGTLDIAKRQLHLATRQLQELPERVTETGFASLTELTFDFSSRMLTANIPPTLSRQFDLPRNKIDGLVHDLRNASLAHMAGGEIPTMAQFKTAVTYANDPDADIALLGRLLLSLWHDLPPKDDQALFILKPQPTTDNL